MTHDLLDHVAVGALDRSPHSRYLWESDSPFNKASLAARQWVDVSPKSVAEERKFFGPKKLMKVSPGPSAARPRVYKIVEAGGKRFAVEGIKDPISTALPLLAVDSIQLFASIRKKRSNSLVVSDKSSIVNSNGSTFPSKALVRLVIQQSIDDANAKGNQFAPDSNLAADHIRQGVFNLFRSMCFPSDVSRADTKIFSLSERGRFTPAVAEALLARISVPYYKSVNFLDQLHQELIRVVPLSGPGWNLTAEDKKNLSIVPGDSFVRSRIPDTKRTKATAPKFAPNN